MKVHKKNPSGINDEVLLDFESVETSFMVFHYCKHILFIILTLRLVIYESSWFCGFWIYQFLDGLTTLT